MTFGFDAKFPKGFHGSSARYIVEYMGTNARYYRATVKESSPSEAAEKIRQRGATKIIHVEQK